MAEYVCFVTMDDCNDNKMGVEMKDTPVPLFNDPLWMEEDWLKSTRACFSKYQRQQLEKVFEIHRYLAPKMRDDLASSLGVSPKRVQNWFQNQRSKRPLQTKAIYLHEQVEDIHAKYQHLLCERNKIAQELGEERLKNDELNKKVNKLTRKLALMEDLKRRISQELERETNED